MQTQNEISYQDAIENFLSRASKQEIDSTDSHKTFDWDSTKVEYLLESFNQALVLSEIIKSPLNFEDMFELDFKMKQIE